ncbi:hypothetical protein [Ketobacter alkanivorans]|uniref:Uncharacterized protein n=1 Tax=Ketobacter alkanivorans TaxID=1917421 RepID=A0A2K9LQY4_9GAMM|nr:hypothetical protein [Ketobacter alkanivorans]AUM14703.1 hypothetical protein Kalk_20715 [Ketobacter alkanivorans]
MSNNEEDDVRQSLRVQLTELNNRSRWYSSQLWQLPFAYLGVTGLLFGGVAGGELFEWLILCLVVFLSGPFVIEHMSNIADGERRAVKNLIAVEDKLGIPNTAQYKECYTTPLHRLVKVVFVLSGFSSLFIATKIMSFW